MYWTGGQIQNLINIDNKECGKNDRTLRNSSISIEWRGWYFNFILNTTVWEKAFKPLPESRGEAKDAGNLARRFLCQTWSKAFEMPKSIIKVSLPVSRTLFQIWDNLYIYRISQVDRNCLKPYCLSWVSLLNSKCRRIDL